VPKDVRDPLERRAGCGGGQILDLPVCQALGVGGISRPSYATARARHDRIRNMGGDELADDIPGLDDGLRLIHSGFDAGEIAGEAILSACIVDLSGGPIGEKFGRVG
jgi:hypothetical protein